MENLIIRTATFSDLPIVRELISELVDSLARKDNIDVNIAVKNYHNILRDKNSYMLLAEVNNKILGFVDFSIRQTLLHNGYSGLIEELIVTKNFQGKNIGIKLLDAAIKECENLGCCEVEVSTESSNIPAVQLYKRYGFDEKGIFLEIDL